MVAAAVRQEGPPTHPQLHAWHLGGKLRPGRHRGYGDRRSGI